MAAIKQPNTPIPSVSGVPLVEPTSDAFAAQSGELGGGIQPTYWQKFWSQTELNLHDAPYGVQLDNQDPGGALFRMANQMAVEKSASDSGSLKLSRDEANRQFPGLEKPFSEPVYPEVARLIYDEQQRVNRQKAWINRGPQTGPLFDLASSLPVGLDPFNVVAGALIPEAKGLGPIATVAQRFAGNFAVNLAGEVPGLIQNSREQKNLPSATEVGLNAAGGAVIGTGIHTMMDMALSHASEIVAQKPKAVVENGTNAAIDMHERGKAIDMTPIAALQAVRDAGHVATGVENPYTYRQLAHPSESNYYVSIDPETGSIKSIDDLGGGIVGVDNPAVANNASGVPESAYNGKIVQAELSQDSNLVDSETTLKDFFQSGREKALEKIQGILGIDDRRLEGYRDRFRKIWTQGGSVRDLFNLFQNAATDRVRAYNDIPANDFKNLLDGMGFDGIKFNGRVGETPIDNRILLFNHDKLSPIEVTDAQKASVPQYTPEQQKAFSEQAMAPSNDRFIDPETQKVAQEKSLMNDQKVDVPKIQERFTQEEENVRATLDELAKQPGNEHILEEVLKADQEFEADQHMAEAAKNLANCIEKGIA